MRRKIFFGLLVGLLLWAPALGSPTSIIKDIQIEWSQKEVLLTIFCQGEMSYQI